MILLLDQEAGDPKSAQTQRKTASPSKVKGLDLNLAGALCMLGCLTTTQRLSFPWLETQQGLLGPQLESRCELGEMSEGWHGGNPLTDPLWMSAKGLG